MSAKITKLPPALEADLPAIRDKWIGIGLSHQPIDRATVTAAIRDMYAVVGKPPPRFTIILDSPLAVCLAVGMLRIDQVRAQVRDQVSDQVSDQVRAQVIDQVSDQVRAQVRDQVSDQVIDQVSAQVRDQVSDQVSDQVRAQVIDQVRDQVRDQVIDQVRDLINYRWWYGFGQFETYWVSFYEVMARLGVDISKLEPMARLAESAGWSLMFWDWAFVSRRPSAPVQRDDRGRLHCLTGPACGYADGFGVWAVHGVRVRRYMIEEPQKITVAEIESERNAEVRRVMIELYGQGRYLIDSGAVEIHRDDYGTLYRKEIPGDEPLVMVKVVNSTPEPDGSFRDYFLRVPPGIERAHQAVAWSFDVPEEDYEPALET